MPEHGSRSSSIVALGALPEREEHNFADRRDPKFALHFPARRYSSPDEGAIRTRRPPDQSAAARLAICFCLGAVLGTLLDGIHVYGDVESYPIQCSGAGHGSCRSSSGWRARSPGALIPALERRAGPPRPPHWPLGVRVAELCLIVAAYLSTVVLDEAPVLVTAGLLALLAIRLAFRPVPR